MQIGVIGGGPSAVCLLDSLALSPLPPGDVIIFEPSAHLWRGRPFQPDMASVRVNAPPDDMSVRRGDTGHFERWLEEQAEFDTTLTPDPWSGTPFVPRAVYGEYLRDSARAAIDTLRARGWRVQLARVAVTAMVRTPDRVVLRTAHGRHHAVEAAILCVGGGPPADTYGLTGTPGFIAEPYPLRDRLRRIGADHRVAVVGSGLTAVDVVVSLAAHGHRGPISLVSRTGVLPGVRQRQVSYQLRHFTVAHLRSATLRQEPVSLESLTSLMLKELVDAGANPEALRAEIESTATETPVARLRRHLNEVNSPDIGLRILQRAVPDTGPDVWPILPEHERAAVLRRYHRTLMSLCCPMPPTNAATLLRLVDSGQLRIVPGVRHIERRPNGFEVVADGATLCADRVINAVSASAHRIPPAAQALVMSMVDSGAAARHPRGGLHIDRATSQVVVGEPDPRVFALGDLTAGTLFFTFGIPSLVDRAEDITRALVESATAPAGQRAMARVG